ncbi:hypothetical protein Godav_009410 [Gossypium davidsonii]|uniref:Uncharacterized protein n=2 Tax=Gossypium TaxID=3633 RepID=A0A7J8SDQ8_GOSDV|nr:hypothetical protein [Gossypium davidsonii]MBA0659576.1 hypothetical protein [Gossypium klotzschianum]
MVKIKLMYKCIFNQPKILSLHFFDALITKGYYLIHLWSFLNPRIWCPWGFLFDCIERRNELGFPYWAGYFKACRSFMMKRMSFKRMI